MDKSLRFIPVRLFVLWWLFWLIIHNTSLSPIFAASFKTQFFFVVMLLMVSIGYISAFSHTKPLKKKLTHLKYKISITGKILFIFLLSFLLIILVDIGYNTGAFSMTPKEYFFYIRGSQGIGKELTQNNYFDIFLSIIFYPLMYSMWVISIVLPDGKFRTRIIFSLVFVFLLFSYIYQVNYPIDAIVSILFIYLFIFKRDSSGKIPKNIRKIFFITLIFFGTFMMYAAYNRYGSFELTQIFKRYLITYHTLGFYFFDIKLNDFSSILNTHPSFGRSILGWFDSIFDLFLRFFFEGNSYIAANLQNRNDNMVPIISGKIDNSQLTGNAFSTILFTMYRDFKLAGIIFYSLIYGVFLAYSYSYSNNIKWKAIFIILLFSGIKSIGMSNVELPYFWFSILFILVFSIMFIKRVEIDLENR